MKEKTDFSLKFRDKEGGILGFLPKIRVTVRISLETAHS